MSTQIPTPDPTTRQTVQIAIRPAVVADTKPIVQLINDLAVQQVMLPRSPGSVIENIRDFIVAEVDGDFAGCGALAVTWTDIAEVRSLAVSPTHQQHGLGRKIVDTLVEDAERLLAQLQADGREELRTREQSVDAMQRAVADLDRRLASMRAASDGLSVRAPVAGRLTGMALQVGESVRTGSRLARIDSLGGKPPVVVQRRQILALPPQPRCRV